MNHFAKETQRTSKQMPEGTSHCPESKKRIAILFGGCSPEYSVSLQSAYSVITHLNREKYIPVLIGISNAGDWFQYEGELEKISADEWCNEKDCTPVVVSPNRTVLTLFFQYYMERMGRTVPYRDCLSLQEYLLWDAAFFLLHYAWTRTGLIN